MKIRKVFHIREHRHQSLLKVLPTVPSEDVAAFILDLAEDCLRLRKLVAVPAIADDHTLFRQSQSDGRRATSSVPPSTEPPNEPPRAMAGKIAPAKGSFFIKKKSY